MSFIKKLISKLTTYDKKTEKKEFLCQDVLNFFDVNKINLTGQKAFSHLKVFQSVKTPKNPSIVEIKLRLEHALNYLHLPAAYKDILTCFRMIIRIKRKQGISHLSELKSLYKYACQHNFFNAEPYLKKAKEPAFNLEEVIEKDFFDTFKMPYEDIGYEKIKELNKTDIKWLLSEFGKPKSHHSVTYYYKKERGRLEELLIDKRKKESDSFWS